MLSMVLLVLLLCFEPAKASLFQPAKATLFLGLCMQPAKARPPLPWWRCRVWENKYWLCSPDGYGRGLTEEEEDEIEEIFDRNTDAAKYVWQQSSEHLAGNCWRVSWDEPLWWYQYEEPHNAGTPDYYQHWEDWNAWQPERGYVRRTEPAQGYGHSSSRSQPAQGYQWPFQRQGQPRARSRAPSRARRSQSRPPDKRPHQPAKAAPKADAYQHMYRGQGARSKRTARRGLQAAGLEVPSSLKPGKAVNDLPEPEKAEAKALQKRLKELRFSNRFSTSEVEWEVSQVKARLHELLGPGDGDEEDEEEDELAKAEQVNKELQHAIEMAKTLTGALNQQCNETPVKEEPEKAKPAEANTAQPAEATTTQPVEATQVEPAKANGSLPTGDTEESEEEEEWQKVGEKKTKRKKPKNPKRILSLQRLSTFLFSLQRLHL